jgi:hypothetical protein
MKDTLREAEQLYLEGCSEGERMLVRLTQKHPADMLWIARNYRERVTNYDMLVSKQALLISMVNTITQACVDIGYLLKQKSGFYK